MPTTISADEVRHAYRLTANVSDRVKLFNALAAAVKKDASLARNIFAFIRKDIFEVGYNENAPGPVARLKVFTAIYESCPDLATAKDVGMYLDFYTKEWPEMEDARGLVVPKFLPVLKAMFRRKNPKLEKSAIEFAKEKLTSEKWKTRDQGVQCLVALAQCSSSLKTAGFDPLIKLIDRENQDNIEMPWGYELKHFWDDPKLGNEALLEKIHKWGHNELKEEFSNAHPERMPWKATADRLRKLAR